MSTVGQSGDVAAEVRRRQILELIRSRDFARVSDISTLFRVSEVTVRSDLDVLADRGQIRRVRGGALSRLQPHPERSFEESQNTSAPQKSAIAQAAAELVSIGETLILDVGTTTTALAQALIAREDLHDLVIFTNALNIALELEAVVPRFTVVVMGGTLRPMAHSLMDPLGEQTLERINADTLFLACNGIDLERGITNTNLPEVAMKRRLLHAARRRIVLADSTKVGAVALAHICDVDGVDLLITDTGVNTTLVAALRERKLDVLVVE